MSKKQEKDGRLSRWSKRKLAASSGEQQIEDEVPEVIEPEVDEAREAELLANRQAAEEIDLDTIDEESDLSIFMKDGVPEMLKKQALAVLWRSNPVFANIDGLCDYDDDFANPNLNMKIFKSAYQAGRGYLDQVNEKLDEIAEAPEDGVSDGEPDIKTADAEEIIEDSQPENTDEPVLVEVEIEDEFELEEQPKVSLRDRMGLA